MKTWKRISALVLGVCTFGISVLSAGCDISGAIGGQSGSSISNSQESSSESVHTHDWKEEIKKAATCTEDGEKVLKCDCGEEKDEEVIPAGHDLVRYRESDATCSQEGYVRIFCNNCEYTTYEIEERKNHMYLFTGKCFWCGKSKTETGTPLGPAPVVAYDGSSVTITFYHTMGAVLRETLDSLIPAFNAMYPNITVVHDTQGDYDSLRDQIANELVAGRAPNIAYCYSDHVAMYKQANAVAVLDDYIANTEIVATAYGTTELMGFTDEQVNRFIDTFYEEGRVFGDGKMYTLPFSKSTEVLYYNKTFFEEHNLTVPATWDEMEAVMQAIVEIDPKCIPLGYDTEANWFITMCEQLGTPYTSTVEGQKFLFDVAANRQFVERFRDWYQKGYVITGETYGNYTSDLFTETEPSSWKSYMCIGSSAGASYQVPDYYYNEHGEIVYPFEVGVAQIPQVDVNNPKVVLQGPSLCMFQKADPQEMAAAWLFMKFLTSNEMVQASFSFNSGYAPVLEYLDEKVPAYRDFLEQGDGYQNLKATVIKQCLAQADAMFVSPAFFGSSGARDQVGILMKNCFMDQPASGQSVADMIKGHFAATIETLHYRYGA